MSESRWFQDGILPKLDDQETLDEVTNKLLAEARSAALAYQQMCVCYRIGKRPSEKLFKQLEKAKEAILRWNGNKGETK